MSIRRKCGDWVWLGPNTGFVGESDRTARAALTTEIEAAGHCTCVGAVGATALFYKPAGDPSKSSLPVA
jgi:RNA-binding protein YhbY